jgi:hypothetical protein
MDKYSDTMGKGTRYAWAKRAPAWVSDFKKDIELVSEVCENFYDRLIEIYDWNTEKY